MRLFIETKDGQTINHPAFENNLIEVFGSVPAHWEAFVRVERPVPGIYEVLDSEVPTYQKIDGVWTDVWSLRAMTDEEKLTKQQAKKEAWASQYQAENWKSWLFDEETCLFFPPIPPPVVPKGKIIFWCGAENNWKEAPPYPKDGKRYQFDFFVWQWQEIIGAE